jgi:prepilin-type N-terminal cleavage/methylation domain-containing protein
MKKGFTLIELMIIVAIIGILVAIAIPKFSDLFGQAKIKTYYKELIELKPYSQSELEKECEEAIALFNSRDFSKGYEISNYTTDFNTFKKMSKGGAIKTYTNFLLQNGAIVSCGRIESSNGTVSLYDCTDGRNYLAQTNVTQSK